MKQSLDHLPAGKRRELEFVVETLRVAFAGAVAHRTMPRFRNAKLLKIILFGSYARGDWVEDPVGRYFSDFDILVIVNHEDLTDVPEFWAKAEETLVEALASGQHLRTPVSVIYHALDDVNEQLTLGRYFFTDIVRDGVVLFEEPGHPLAAPAPLSAAQALQESRDYYEEWLKSADQFFETGREHVVRGPDWSKKAAFELHQAAERYYHTLFLVLTLYSPKTHSLNQLRKLAEGLDPALAQVWPGQNKFERRCYELIREAYVKARYSRHYHITDEQLAWLEERIGVLREMVRERCEKRLAELQSAA
ncbi:HEPN domain-containing protein [Caulobacter rhizosphaerae]|jgi:predicted nucleotidyltransferase/HEPN domain-containing protein|uniref:HEPN domain-containing protein n=1 Tax=Caulobacter rhizosphaerae TaxID=2010972 RepID=UPI0013D53810|nr:HEPN domain-containing protein [Caulobacter rhizosphaerae]GGL30848.1 nucleotidyltransferase [Caulobacter rhizosphaerae]